MPTITVTSQNPSQNLAVANNSFRITEILSKGGNFNVSTFELHDLNSTLLASFTFTNYKIQELANGSLRYFDIVTAPNNVRCNHHQCQLFVQTGVPNRTFDFDITYV